MWTGRSVLVPLIALEVVGLELAVERLLSFLIALLDIVEQLEEPKLARNRCES